MIGYFAESANKHLFQEFKKRDLLASPFSERRFAFRQKFKSHFFCHAMTNSQWEQMAGKRLPPLDFFFVERSFEGTLCDTVFVMHENACPFVHTLCCVKTGKSIDNTMSFDPITMLLWEIFLHDRKSLVDLVDRQIRNRSAPAPLQSAAGALALNQLACEVNVCDLALNQYFVDCEHIFLSKDTLFCVKRKGFLA